MEIPGDAQPWSVELCTESGADLLLEVMDLDPIGVSVGLRKWLMEMEIQRLELLDLERNGNPLGKVIHKLWKR